MQLINFLYVMILSENPHIESDAILLARVLWLSYAPFR